jgi:protein-tyrosine kinase
MLIPKASHLVERVAERLLRSGALDSSAAQLLRDPGADPATEVASQEPPAPISVSTAASRAEAVQRSSLFAPAPRQAASAPIAAQGFAASGFTAQALAPPSSLPDAPPGDEDPGQEAPEFDSPHLASPGFEVPADRHAATRPPSLGQTAPAPALAAPAILGQARILGQPVNQTGLLDRPTDFPQSAPGAAPRGLPTDPAAALLQGPMSVDAVSLERAGMVDWSRTRTRISEEFRLVQRQIIRSAFGPGAEPGFSNLLLVTSARPGEGKSFMSTNLAGSIARQGDHHVLLVDADSKRDSICYSLGLAQARGLLDLAANPKLDPSPLIVKTPIERLSILPVGRERERSAELFSTKEMTRLIQSLGRRYADRLLILDAPPCLSTSDPAVLAQVVGQILFVVEADRTQRDEIEASLDLIQACPTITMVLNKQQISSRYTFGAYSSYYSS